MGLAMGARNVERVDKSLLRRPGGRRPPRMTAREERRWMGLAALGPLLRCSPDAAASEWLGAVSH